MCKTILSSQHATTVKTSKEGKNQKSTDKHSSFDGLIQEDIDLSDVYLAVHFITVLNYRKLSIVCGGYNSKNNVKSNRE